MYIHSVYTLYSIIRRKVSGAEKKLRFQTHQIIGKISERGHIPRNPSEILKCQRQRKTFTIFPSVKTGYL